MQDVRKQAIVAATPRRGRPPGRSAQQEAQRRRNRAAIVAAAAGVFARKPYAHATIDELIAAAGISRATFYVHFESKLALAFEIYEGIVGDWLAHFDRLAAQDLADADGLARWVLDLVRLYLDHGYVTPLVEQLAVFEAAFRQRLAADRDRLIDRLAEAGLPGCMLAMGTRPEATMQRARLRLMLQRLDQLCGTLARGEAGYRAEADACVAAMAEELGARLDPGISPD